MRSVSSRLLAGVVCFFVLISVILYNSLETRNVEQKQSFEVKENELDRLEREIQILENEVKKHGELMNSMLQKVNEARRASKLNETKAKSVQNVDHKSYGKERGKERGVGDESNIGFLKPPKKPEEIEEDARNAEEAAEHKAEEEQARQGVIHPPEKPLQEPEMTAKISPKVSATKQFLDRLSSPHPSNMCYAALSMTRPQGNIQMLDMYSVLSFDDTDGGVWKQGFDITYSENAVLREKRLEVIVVPHSHTDPGWIKTFEDYYATQTRNILNNMLEELQLANEMRFVYAEISFFERWWAEISKEKREIVKQLLKSRKLEILSGGWVMTDEANTHYYAVISQLMEGHEWIRNHIGEDYKPKNHWSIDPFGLSPTISYFMKMSNFSNGVIQRVHYSVKKYLAEKKQLEFKWRQLWGGSDTSTDFATQVMPFFSYDVPHTCGPDPKICCQFDFKRNRASGLSCPWGKPSVPITETNVKERAKLLYDQYRKKAQLFKTNVVLVPLGDDFRYDTEMEWNLQYKNYMMLFNYMNAQSRWNINARFGTLEDYFSLVRERLNEDGKELPVLSGDFFTYADRNDHYWSGYYTSRPFFKRLDRVLQHYVRTAEILYSAMIMKGLESDDASKLFGLLVEARRSMSLFQHHDGVTGTSKDEVMNDYGQKMFSAIKNCEKVILSATSFLLSQNVMKNIVVPPNLIMEEDRITFDSLPRKQVVVFPNLANEMILFNPLGSARTETLCVHVNTLNTVVVLASKPNVVIQQQIGPIVESIRNEWVINLQLFELCFVATIQPFSFQKYLFKLGTPPNKAKIRVNFPGLQSSNFDIAPLGDLKFENGLISATFDRETGYLASVSLKEKEDISVSTSFVTYEARKKSPVPIKGSDNLPGAYLFLPEGPATTLKTAHSFIAVQGPIMQKMVVANYGQFTFTHIIKLPYSSLSIEIENTVHLNKVEDTELAMRLQTSIDNGNEFFTDLNGFQMIKRRRFKQLPLQAHFYPMAASAFIEDKTVRMTLLTAQPLGIANLESGSLDVMLDRRMNHDDERGLFSGVTDNRKTTSIFRLLFEVPDQNVPIDINAGVTAYHSREAYSGMLSLLYPPVVMLASQDDGHANDYKLLDSTLPCDMHVVTLRTLASPTIYGADSARSYMPQRSLAFILHRFGIDCRFTSKPSQTCDVTLNLKRLFTNAPSRVTEMSLTTLYERSGDVNEVVTKPMEVRTFRLDYS